MKLETTRFLDTEMAYAIKEAKHIEFTEPDQAEWVRRYMVGVYQKAQHMEQQAKLYDRIQARIDRNSKDRAQTNG